MDKWIAKYLDDIGEAISVLEAGIRPEHPLPDTMQSTVAIGKQSHRDLVYRLTKLIPKDHRKILELLDEIKHRISWLTMQTADANKWATKKLERDEEDYHNKITTIKQMLTGEPAEAPLAEPGLNAAAPHKHHLRESIITEPPICKTCNLHTQPRKGIHTCISVKATLGNPSDAIVKHHFENGGAPANCPHAKPNEPNDA